MSRDCDYIFSWECQPYLLNPIEEAIAAISATFPDGTAKRIDDETLYWSCLKNGLILSDIKFPIPPDQIFERGNKELWRPAVLPTSRSD